MINDIHRLRLTLSEKRLSHLVDVVQKNIDNGPAVDAFCLEELENYKKQIEYMRMYAFGDKKDPYRQQVFDNTVVGLQRLARDVIKCTRIELSTELRGMKKMSPESDFDLPSIRRNLEDYVSSMTMTTITGEDQKKIIEKHIAYITRLFNYIVTGRLWNETNKKFFSEILSSSVIDYTDALVLISAVTMSTLLVHDELKVETLLDVYTTSNNSEIKDRALVGWVLGLHAAGGMCENVIDRVKELVKDEELIKHLLELQIQLFYCSDAEKDKEVIERDIIPDFVKNNGGKLNRFGIIDDEIDDLKDLAKKNFDIDNNMDALEKELEKIQEMENNGADVYFGGFARMKNYSFFFPMVNWFYPFVTTHPDIQSAIKKFNGAHFMDVINKGPFCDSDKYSFALAISELYNTLPDEIKTMLSSEDVGSLVRFGTYTKRSHKLRIYIQNLYRFYKLNSVAKYMDDPFKEENGIMRGFFFDDYFLYCDETIKAKQYLAQFIIKKRGEGEELNLLFDSYESNDTNDKFLRAGYMLQHGDKNGIARALEIYLDIYSREPEKAGVLHGIVRALSSLGKFEEACRYSTLLIEENPDSKNSLLNHSIILIKCNQLSDANKILFKLNYEYPTDRNVMRVLSWCLLMEDKQEKSIEMFDKLMSSGKVTPEDNLNAGFARWVTGDEQKAADYFALFTKSKNLHELAHEIDNERVFLKKHDIMEVDMCMMLDLVEERTKQA